MVVGVHMDVEQVGGRALGEPREDVTTSAFAEIGDTFQHGPIVDQMEPTGAVIAPTKKFTGQVPHRRRQWQNGAVLGILESPADWAIILIVVVVLFGGSQLPKLARNIGQAQKEFKKGLTEGMKDGKSESSGKADTSEASKESPKSDG